MGKTDAESKKYLAINRIFADAFNYLIYEGEEVIQADSLRPVDTTELTMPYGNGARFPIQLIAPAEMDDEDFDKFNTDLGFAMKVIKHQNIDAADIIKGTKNRRIDRDTAEFLNNIVDLNLVYSEPKEENEVSMCKSMEI